MAVYGKNTVIGMNTVITPPQPGVKRAVYQNVMYNGEVGNVRWEYGKEPVFYSGRTVLGPARAYHPGYVRSPDYVRPPAYRKPPVNKKPVKKSRAKKSTCRKSMRKH